MRARLKTMAVIGVLLALGLALTGPAAAPAVAKQAKHKKVKSGPIPPDFFGIVPIFAPSASDAQQMSTAGVESPCGSSPTGDSWSRSPASTTGPRRRGDPERRGRRAHPRGAVRELTILDLAEQSDAALRSTATRRCSRWQSLPGELHAQIRSHGSFWAAHPSLPYHPMTSYRDLERAEPQVVLGRPPEPPRLSEAPQDQQAGDSRRGPQRHRSSSAGCSPSPCPSSG